MASVWELPVGPHINQAMPRLCPRGTGMGAHRFELYTREDKLQVQCADCAGYLLADGQLENVDLHPLPIEVNTVNDEGQISFLELYARHERF